MEIPERVHDKIMSALLQNAKSSCEANIQEIFKIYDHTGGDCDFLVKTYAEFLLPITTEEKLEVCLFALKDFLALKENINDEYANDGEGRFDMWRSHDLSRLILVVEHIVEQYSRAVDNKKSQ